jgi:L-lactate dehydrogenase complex protein LldF
MAEVTTRQFVRASQAAVKDAQLRQALRRAGTGFDGTRREAIEEVTPEVWEEWRVHFAVDADQANAIVSEIARANDVRTVTKSKSMVSEELGLNHVLEAQGIDVFETDLGEYIIQLADETPSHLVAPALHKTRGQVAQLFAAQLGVPYSDDIEEMARIARVALRQKFLDADMGISGANFLVAETGSLVIITNEGNGRLCTSAPRVHVGLAGMEKVIPSLQDLAVFLRLLPRSATGQRITSYMSMVTGPRRPEDEDGPEEFHLVIVDNGRSRLLADPALRESLYCIRCGACLNVCPVYQRVGGHAYGWVYPGPIGSIVTPGLVGVGQAKDLPNASTLCGACRDACPVQINIPRMLLHLRHNIAEGSESYGGTGTDTDSLLARGFASFMSSPRLLNIGRWIGRRLLAPIAKGGVLGPTRIPLVSRWTRSRDLPVPAPRSFSEIWRDELAGEQSNRSGD